MNLPQSHKPLDREINILLLEDSNADKMLIEQELSHASLLHRMHHVSDRESFLQALAGKSPDIIISDVSLDDMNGMEFLKIVKASAKLKDVPMIMMSAKYIEPVDRVNALKAGAIAYYSKPFDVEKLCNEIKYYVRKKGK